VHELDPKTEKVPAAQTPEHFDSESPNVAPYVPAAQITHKLLDAAPVELRYLPEAQLAQIAWPVLAW